MSWRIDQNLTCGVVSKNVCGVILEVLKMFHYQFQNNHEDPPINSRYDEAIGSISVNALLNLK